MKRGNTANFHIVSPCSFAESGKRENLSSLSFERPDHFYKFFCGSLQKPQYARLCRSSRRRRLARRPSRVFTGVSPKRSLPLFPLFSSHRGPNRHGFEGAHTGSRFAPHDAFWHTTNFFTAGFRRPNKPLCLGFSYHVDEISFLFWRKYMQSVMHYTRRKNWPN